MGSVFSSAAEVVGFIAANMYEFIFPLRGVVGNTRDLLRRSEEERDASIRHHARFALLHYNSKNPGAEFDLVKPLMVAHVLFRGDWWFHISFWARRRGAPLETPVQQFFGELHYRSCACDVHDDDVPGPIHSCNIPVVETCAIVNKISTFQPQPPTRKKKKPRRRVCILCSRAS
uniref:Uncharacterized protein n=1 Tax=Avena sativa TaxID=4498 RepID=A0ACD5WUH5_AVESA